MLGNIALDRQNTSEVSVKCIFVYLWEFSEG